MSRREEADDYRAIVAKLNDYWRVIECRDAIQWILQKRCGTRHGQPRWEGRKYNRTREALLRHVRALVSDGATLAIFEQLPERMEARR